MSKSMLIPSNIMVNDDKNEKIPTESNQSTQNTNPEDRNLLERYSLFKLDEDTCRACLKQNVDLRLLFTGENVINSLDEKDTSVIEMFTSCTSLEISMNDQYPKHICKECLQELTQYFKFWKKCRNSVKEFDKINEKVNAGCIENEIDLSLIKYEPINTLDNDKNIDNDTDKNIAPDIVNDIITTDVDVKTPISKPKRIRYKKPKPLIRLTKTKKTKLIPTHADNLLPVANIEKQEYVCGINEQKLNTHKQLLVHIEKNISHKNQKPRYCRKCDLVFKNRLEYNRHAKTHNSFLCPHCGHISKSRSSFNAHISTHSNLKPFECKSCDRKYKSLCSLQVHMRNHTGEMRYTCQHCEKKFITWNSMRSHIRTHHSNERPYVCPICLKAFKQSSTLTTHKRLHTGEKPYQCNECFKSFRSKGDLSGHMVRHTGEKNYPCTVCDKRFARSYNLTQHMVTHTGERKHICDFCDKSFTQAHVLRGHLKTHNVLPVKHTLS